MITFNVELHIDTSPRTASHSMVCEVICTADDGALVAQERVTVEMKGESSRQIRWADLDAARLAAMERAVAGLHRKLEPIVARHDLVKADLESLRGGA